VALKGLNKELFNRKTRHRYHQGIKFELLRDGFRSKKRN